MSTRGATAARNGHLTKVEQAWLACAIDGEGSVVMGKAYRRGYGPIFVPMVTVCNTDKHWITRCRELISRVCGHTVNSNAHNGKHKPLLRVCVNNFTKVIPLLKEVLPYLIIKKQRAEYVMALWERRKHRRYSSYDSIDLLLIALARYTETSKWIKKTLEREL